MKIKHLFLQLYALLAFTDAYCSNVSLNEIRYLYTTNDDPIIFTQPITITCGYDISVAFAKKVSEDSDAMTTQNYDFQNMGQINLVYCEKDAVGNTPASTGRFLIPLESVIPFNKYSKQKLDDSNEYTGIITKIQSLYNTKITGLSYITHSETGSVSTVEITQTIIKKFFSPAKVFLQNLNSNEEEITEDVALTEKQKKVIMGVPQGEILDDFAVTVKTENINKNDHLIILNTAGSCSEYKIATKINIATSFATPNNIDASTTVALFKTYKETTFSGINSLVGGTVMIDTSSNVIFTGNHSMFLNTEVTAQNNPTGCLTFPKESINTIQTLTVKDCGFNNQGTINIQKDGTLCFSYGV